MGMMMRYAMKMIVSTLVKHATGGGGENGGVGERRCCVCMDRKIQVVVNPFGPACKCRKCSFRVDKCPMCRLDIQAQQRFYM